MVTSVRFADDKALAASTEERLQDVVDGLGTAGMMFGMKINIGKTKMMHISKSPRNI